LRARRGAGRGVEGRPPGAVGEVHPDLRRGRHDRGHARDDRCRPRDAGDLASVPRARRGSDGPRRRVRRRSPGRHGRSDSEIRADHRARQSSLARPGSPPGPPARARRPARARLAARRAPGRADPRRLRHLCGAPAARGGEARLTSPARAAWRYDWHYRARYAFGVVCLAAATLASLAIPWTVKRAIDALQTHPATAPCGYDVALIVVFAVGNGVAPLGARFAITGVCQLSVLSARVQEYLSGMSVVRAYTLEPRARADFGQANREYLRLSLDLARTQAGFAPAMGLIAGVGTLVVLWAGGRAVVDGRLSL